FGLFAAGFGLLDVVWKDTRGMHKLDFNDIDEDLCFLLQAYTMELEAEVQKLKEQNAELQKKQEQIMEMQQNQVYQDLENPNFCFECTSGYSGKTSNVSTRME
ncbi:hypothetical protein ACJX0J_020109, partial [Zea mays]